MWNKKPGGSLVDQVSSIFLFWAVFATVMSVVGLWWGGHYFLERSLQKEALDLVPHFDEMGTPLYFSDSGDNTVERIRQFASRNQDILLIGYYTAEDMKLVGQYAKSGVDKSPPLQLDKASHPEPVALADYGFGFLSSLRVIAPIRTRSIDPSSLLDIAHTEASPESAKTIGYLVVEMDIEPRRNILIASMMVLDAFMILVLFGAYFMGRRSIRGALKPLLDLQAPLGQLAQGDFNISVETGNASREVATIGNALSATINALRQQAQEKEEALYEKLSAEAESQAKSQFLAHMSHEIRTPLNGLLGFLELLAKTPLDEIQRGYLHTCEVSSNALLAIINDILDLSKIEAGKLAIANVGFDLRETVDDCMAMYAPAALSKRMGLTLLFRHEVPCRLVGDASRICQVLSNLLSNAVKFTASGEILVQVQLIGETAERAHIRVSVTDTGIGIQPQQMTKLFQPFSQAHEFTTRQYGGTGLGLVISKKIVETMGGGIGVQSSGGGSCFFFTLDLHKQPLSAESPTRSLPVSRVLVISPNANVASSLREDMLAWGVSGQTATTARDGLALLASAFESGREFHAVIFDEATGDSSPSYFAEAVREDARFAALRLVLLNDSLSQSIAMQSLGFESRLSKPHKSADLYMALGRDMGSVEQTESASLVAAPEGKQLRMLVVDDNRINRELTVILLKAMGIESDQAEDGADAIRAVRVQGPYDMILMDINMPTMDGKDATGRIRKMEHGARTPIIALTANALRGDRQHFLDAGMDGYLSKPIGEKDLRAVIGQWFPEQKLAATQGMPAAQQEQTVPSAVIDSKLGVEQAFGAADFWRKAIAALLKELPGALADIEKAYTESRFEDLRQRAHRLYGTAIHCGTPVLQRAIKDVEMACTVTPNQIGNKLDVLKAAVVELMEFIDAHGVPEVESHGDS